MIHGLEDFGVVLFDDGVPGACWVARNGADAVRKAGIHELESQHLWLTNLGFEAFRAYNFGRHGGLRHSQYLRAPLESIIDEWGLGGQPSEFVASALSALFANVMHLAAGLGSLPFTQQALTHEVAPLLPAPELPNVGSMIATRNALQELTQVISRPARAAQIISLRRPRSLHARELLQAPMPIGPWRYLSDAELPPSRDRLKWSEDKAGKMPILARVKVHRVDERVAAVLGFGTGARDDSRRALRREWVAAPELAALRELGDVEIQEVWMGHRLAAPELRPEIDELLNDPMSVYSWSSGLLAEILWSAATLKQAMPPPDGQGARGRPEMVVPYWAAWLRSHDRMRMFIAAHALERAGWHVGSYGTGTVRVFAEAKDFPRLVGVATGMGLEVPMWLAGHGAGDQEWGGEPESAVPALLRAQGRRKELLEMDRLPMVAPGDRGGLLTRVLEEVE